MKIKPYYQEENITIYHGDCLEIMPQLEPVDLVVTSPPYNCGKEYELALSEKMYLAFLSDLALCIGNNLNDGGRFSINIPPNICLNGLWIQNLQSLMVALHNSPLTIRDIIAWNQCCGDSSTAWGSWMSANSPSIRHQLEYIVLGYKNTWKRKGGISTFDSTNDFINL